METLDIIIFVIIAIGAWRGYKSGILIELVMLLAFIVGVFLAFKLLDKGIEIIGQFIVENKMIPFLAFIVIFVLVFALVTILGKMLKKSFKGTVFGEFDAIAGGIVGGLKMLFGISLLVWMGHELKIDKIIPQLGETLSYTYLDEFAPWVFEMIKTWMPFDDVFSTIKKFVDKPVLTT